MTKKVLKNGIEYFNYRGVWSFRYRYTDDLTGKRTWTKRVKISGTLNEVQKKAESARLSKTSNFQNQDETVINTIEQFISNKETFNQIKENTAKGMRVSANHLEKYLKRIKVKDITLNFCKAMFREMHKDGKSGHVIYLAYSLLNQVLEELALDKQIEDNPCKRIKYIKRPRPNIETKKNKPLTKEQIQKIINIIDGREIEGNTLILVLGLATGMRIGEILGLTWNDINFEEKTVKITKQLNRNGNYDYPKSNSNRIIHYGEKCGDYLKAWKQKQKPDIDKIELDCNGELPICTNIYGKRIMDHSFKNWRERTFIREGLAKYAKEEIWYDKRGIKRIKKSGYIGPTFHSLRFTQATWLAAYGNISVKTTQGRLGHSNVSTTMNIYAQWSPESDVVAAKAANDLFYV